MPNTLRNIRIDQELWAAASIAAAEEGGVSAVIRRLLQAWVISGYDSEELMADVQNAMTTSFEGNTVSYELDEWLIEKYPELDGRPPRRRTVVRYGSGLSPKTCESWPSMTVHPDAPAF